MNTVTERNLFWRALLVEVLPLLGVCVGLNEYLIVNTNANAKVVIVKPMIDNCLNPCGEIALSKSEWVMPWVQVQLMVAFGMIKKEDAPAALKTLEEQWNLRQSL